MGTMQMELTDIEWKNDERVAVSDHPVTITTEDSHLEASSLRLYPDKRQMVLTNGSGILRVGRVEP